MYRNIENRAVSVGVTAIAMFTIGCGKAEPKVATLPLLPSPTTEATVSPTLTPEPTTATPEPPTVTPERSSSLPPKPPTPTPTPIGQTEKIVEHLFPKSSTFLAPLNSPGVTGSSLFYVDGAGNITYAQATKRDCGPGQEEISTFAIKVPGDGIRPVVVQFPGIGTKVAGELAPDKQTIQGRVELEELRSGNKNCPGARVPVRATKTNENLGATWNKARVSIGNVSISDQAALDHLSSLCGACNILTAK